MSHVFELFKHYWLFEKILHSFVVVLCMYLYPPVIFIYLDYTVTANATLLDSSVKLNQLVVRREEMLKKVQIKKKKSWITVKKLSWLNCRKSWPWRWSQKEALTHDTLAEIAQEMLNLFQFRQTQNILLCNICCCYIVIEGEFVEWDRQAQTNRCWFIKIDLQKKKVLLIFINVTSILVLRVPCSLFCDKDSYIVRLVKLLKKLSSRLVFGLEAFKRRLAKIRTVFVQFVLADKSTTWAVSWVENRHFILFYDLLC